jgi:hypothetical protein
MDKIFAAIAAAAMLAGAAVVVPGMTASVMAGAPQAAVKGDRLDLKTYGTACSQHGWPYFESSCLRDIASPTRVAKTVRVVSTDRLTSSDRLPVDRSLVMIARAQ